MTAGHQFASIEQLLVAWLPPRIGGVHVLTELPHDFQNADGPIDLLPVVAVDRISGAELDASPMLDRPVVDVDVYAADRGQAQQIAEQIRHAFRWELSGQRVNGNVFTRTRTIVAPRLLPHANRRIRRYSGNYEFLLHPQP